MARTVAQEIKIDVFFMIVCFIKEYSIWGGFRQGFNRWLLAGSIIYATAEMYALKNLLGVLSGKKAPRGGGTFFPATPQVLYRGIHFCKFSKKDDCS